MESVTTEFSALKHFIIIRANKNIKLLCTSYDLILCLDNAFHLTLSFCPFNRKYPDSGIWISLSNVIHIASHICINEINITSIIIPGNSYNICYRLRLLYNRLKLFKKCYILMSVFGETISADFISI